MVQSRSIAGAGTRFVTRVVFALALLAPALAFAHGGHDKVGCRGCHAALQGKSVYDIPVNTKYVDPKTNKPYSGSTAFCLTCHLETDKGGRGHLPVSRHSSHPFGLEIVNPRVARVPGELLSKDGRFDCMACHDPHPSNRNYKYVRVDVGPGGERMDRFCAACHPAKNDPAKAPPAVISTDGGGGPEAPPAAPASAPASTGKKPAK
ncbi:cytochrome c3 family protein [Anaeromyxobacter oryzae]|uniref:Doubled CXXCH motif domain-containing protein n=1 Tax=Anaeromyxobacter oryzae TaxID=2918170 RepID=A0ABM7X0C2_9BACT|nr:cytochrome c3 family protein [Anaeromyxobacter oryzae]BDG05228.1 hypothetical protein AMOR_42240 [Anaeromyxobacter oryzae]